MKCIQIYEYHLTEDDIMQFIVDGFNRKNNKHMPITKANVKIEFEHKQYCEPEARAVIEIDEEGDI